LSLWTPYHGLFLKEGWFGYIKIFTVSFFKQEWNERVGIYFAFHASDIKSESFD